MRATVLAAVTVAGLVVLQLAAPVRLSAGGWALVAAAAALAAVSDGLRRRRVAAVTAPSYGGRRR